ncbi:hypothetical protein EI427_22240 [Flammeovirga pectinis]|uniref:Peptidase M43 pregnancy-associated plasma-A domain-containing protein n=1 Tax=Flammeovirga pectinis TaxID=2494373 RepID=A0A3S9P9U2_9BACT|nr:M43 family zinc metalloprotease [Flammeovirga pectinis]AZQ64947.1 hypothetical protein EI427_22240 [Flammeovirga pectinis]
MYNKHNIIIRSLGTNYIDDSNFVNINTGNDEHDQLGQINNQSNAINIYIIQSFSDSNILGIATGIPSNSFIIKREYVYSGVTSHELGHCLGLYHTHETAFGKEAISGLNCSSTGDLICDTPADPGLNNNNVNLSCQYIGGGGYTPLTDNIMSYTNTLCMDSFTPYQGARMSYAINNEQLLQNIISNSCSSISDVVTICYNSTTDVNISNLNGATTSWLSSNNVNIISRTNSQVKIKAKSPNTQGVGWIRATLSNGIILEENFKIGTESPNSINVLVDPYIGRIIASVTPIENAKSYIWYLNGVQQVGNSSSIRMIIKRGDCSVRDFDIGVEVVTNCGTSNLKYGRYSNPC